MSAALEELRESLVKSHALPILFAGSGLSRRYIGSPNWEGLLEQFAALTNKSMPYYRGMAGNDLPRMASLIAENFYGEWFDSSKYEDSRSAFEAQVQDFADPLKYEISRAIQCLDYLEEDAVRNELQALAGAHVHAIVTTNWDTILEDVFKDLEVFVGQQDVLFATTQTVGEIYKIHGSITDPTSLILTSKDYSVYWKKNPYLIAKLLTLFVEHPVLFIGYSLRDEHINHMLGNLISCLTAEQIAVLNDRLIFVRRAGGGESDALARSSMTVGDHTLSIREYVCDDFKAMYEMLGSLPQQFPIKLLRQLRESVYELTFSSEPSDRVHVLPMEEGEDFNDVEVVVGVGTMERLGEKGYTALSRADLCRDMLNGAIDHQASQLIGGLLPRLFRGAKYVPIFYPLWLSDRLDVSGHVIDDEGLPANARSLISGATSLRPYGIRDQSRWAERSFRELLTREPTAAVDYGLVSTYDVEDVLALRTFLLERIGAGNVVETSAAKLCCKYERLVFGFDFAGDRTALHQALGLKPRKSSGRASRS